MRFLRELLYLSNIKGLGRSALNTGFVPWRRRRINGGHLDLSAAEEWLALSGRLPDRREREAAEQRTEQVMQWLDSHGTVSVCTVFDERYPGQLNDMGAQRPLVLYINGNTSRCAPPKPSTSGAAGVLSFAELLQMPSLAVIGSRWPSDYTLRSGPDCVRRLVRTAGMPVVSGLARGCDRIGHSAALETGIPTIAVMPCGPDRIVPEVNGDLAEQILEGGGLLVTEYPPGTPPAEYRYVERDRVTAALSAGTCVLECQEKSGTMQTVKAALSLGRPVACWYPENAEKHGFQGNRYMLKRLGVASVTDTGSARRFLQLVQDKSGPRRVMQDQISIF